MRYVKQVKRKKEEGKCLRIWRLVLLLLPFYFFLFTLNAAPVQAPKTAAQKPTVTDQNAGTVTQNPAEPPAPQEGEPAKAADGEATAPSGEELVYLNVQDGDIKDVIKQISKATGRNFIIDDKIRGKVTILSERPMTREEAYQTFLSALEVAGFTIVKGPAGVIKVVPLKEAIQQPIPTHIDSTPITDMFITRLIPLQNISAVEMSSAIKGLVSRDGNLFAYPATNTLIITDSGSNIDRLMKIIKELDQEGPQQVLEIIPIVNATARDVAQMVNQLFEQAKQGGKATAAGKKGGELEEMEEVSKIIPDERTNAIIVLASRRAIDKVRSIIQRLDRKLDDAAEGKIHVHYLKHSKAKTLAETLSTLTQASAAKKDAKAGAASGAIVAEFEGGMKISADEPTNSLIITSSAKDYQTLVDKVISKLDIPRRQVYLEAVVMELSVRKGSDYGVSGWGGVSKGPLNIFGTDPWGGAGMLTSFMSGTPAFPTGMLGGLLGTDTVSVNMGGTTKQIPSMGLFFSALASYGDSNVISTPSILTMDNEEAKIEIKGKEYYKGNPLVSSTGTQYSTQASETGLILNITPQIGEGDNVALKIKQSLSNISGKSTDSQVPNPTKERAIQTSVVTRDGQTVVLGGLMEDQMVTSKDKIPLLGDIPILGNLFKRTTMSKAKVNLLIFITPNILKDPSDFSAILKRKLDERNKFIDMNYGKRQRNQIRESIKNHREDLLEFKEGPGTTGIKAPSVPQTATAPVPVQAKAPVITVAPQAQSELGEIAKTPPPKAPVVAPKPAAQTVQPSPLAPVYDDLALPKSGKKTPPEAAPSAPPVQTPPSVGPGSRGDDIDLAY